MKHYRQTCLPIITLVLLFTAAAARSDDFFSKPPSPSSNALTGGSVNSSFLPVEQAFVLEVSSSADFITFSWQIAPDYYLYKRMFKVQTADGRDLTGDAELSRAIRSYDGYFGPVDVFYHHVEMRVPRSAPPAPAQVSLSYQGCAEAGLCYPVQTQHISL